MSVNAFGQVFPAPVTKIVDPDDTVSDLWLNFFQSMWQRTGQGTGIIPGVAVGISAAGSTQGDAFALTKDWNDVGTVAAGSGVLIPPMKPGQDILIFNSGGNALKIYPPSGMQIDALGVNAAYSLATLKMQVYRVFSLTQIRSFQVG